MNCHLTAMAYNESIVVVNGSQVSEILQTRYPVTYIMNSTNR